MHRPSRPLGVHFGAATFTQWARGIGPVVLARALPEVFEITDGRFRAFVVSTNAQGTTRQMDEEAGGNSGAVERNPDGSTGGSKSNPSPTTGAGGTMGGANGTLRQDEKAGGNNRAVEREGMGEAVPRQSR